MKNRSMKAATRTLGLLMLVVSAQYFAFGQEKGTEASNRGVEPAHTGDRMIGTWQTLVTPRNCATGAALAPAFPGLLTFAKGGTLTGTSSTVPSVFGVWDRLNGGRNYSFAFISQRFAPTGAYIGTQKVRQNAELSPSGNEFTSTGTAEIADANGAIVGTGCATSTGARFE